MFGMFRKKDARELLTEAEAMFAEARFGDAKLAFDRGIGFTLARTWLGTPKMERAIKSQGLIKCCPICPPVSSALTYRTFKARRRWHPWSSGKMDR